MRDPASAGVQSRGGGLTGAVVAHFTINFLNLRHVAHTDLR